MKQTNPAVSDREKREITSKKETFGGQGRSSVVGFRGKLEEIVETRTTSILGKGDST